MTRRILLAALAVLVLAAGPLRADEAALFDAVRQGGHVILVRHALAPGTGDPAAFDVGDCATQRNLDETGRQQARDIGARLRAAGLGDVRLLTSQWCRCRDTARLMDVGEVEEMPALNSFFGAREKRDGQTRAVTEWLAGADLDRPVVMVTHQVNITALTGVFPSPGELVVARIGADGTLEVVGTIGTL